MENSNTIYAEVIRTVREGLSTELRHAIIINKLSRFKKLVTSNYKEIDLQLCLVLAIQKKRGTFVSHIMRALSITLPIPHYDLQVCTCVVCVSMREDSRVFEIYALEIFPAAASLFYVFSQNEDPFCYCLHYAEVLSRIKMLFLKKNLLKAIVNIRKNLNQCISLMLDQTENNKEVKVMLIEELEHDVPFEYDMWSNELGRLLVLSRHELREPIVHRASQSFLEKTFVGHSSVVVSDIWSQGFFKAILIGIFCYIFLTPISIIIPHPKLIRFLTSAQMLALMEIVSTFFYILLVMIGSNAGTQNIHTMICFNISDLYMNVQITCLVMIVARIVDEIYILYLLSYRHYFASVYDYVFSISLAMHFGSLILLPIWSDEVEVHGQHNKKLIDGICGQNRSNVSLCKLYNVISTENIEFLQLLTEPSFYISFCTALGHLFLFLSLGNIFVWQKSIGVLAITIQHMLSDIVKFLSIVGIVWIAYSTAFTNLYNNLKCGSSVFGKTFLSVTVQFFWAMFGMTSPTDYQITGGGDTWDSYFANLSSVQFTIYLGYVLYCTWMIISYIVAVNLLIAMMSVTYQDVQEDKDKTWLYSRSKRMIRFSLVSTRHILAYPAPFNLASPLVYLWRKLLTYLCCRNTDRNHDIKQTKMNAYSISSTSTQRSNFVLRCRNQICVDYKLDVQNAITSTSAPNHKESTSRDSQLDNDVFIDDEFAFTNSTSVYNL